MKDTRLALPRARVGVSGDQVARLEGARGRAPLPGVVLQIVAEGITRARVGEVPAASPASPRRLLSAVRRPPVRR